ncbi:hypothetical protein T01_4927 [Trichinella spiralis]|uniref:Uncharacterized protein n=1 Tax=Trichinella spiralis TaxID=6334 RepID=A0A0V1B4L7_TRISP|nr:hypothetical protein T01_4927 [Trichinella spiralis]
MKLEQQLPLANGLVPDGSIGGTLSSPQADKARWRRQQRIERSASKPTGKSLSHLSRFQTQLTAFLLACQAVN